MRRFLGNYSLAFVGIAATFILEMIANFGLNLTKEYQFIVMAVGLMASLVMATVQHEVPASFKSVLNERLEQLTRGFELYHSMTSIDNKDLESEVVVLARSLSAGEIPAHLAELRVRSLMERITKSFWGSAYYETGKQALLRW